jgi:hypothetical protein
VRCWVLMSGTTPVREGTARRAPRMQERKIYTHIYMYIYIHMYMYTDIYTYTNIRIHIHIQMYIYRHIYIFIYVYRVLYFMSYRGAPRACVLWRELCTHTWAQGAGWRRASPRSVLLAGGGNR